MSEEAKKAIKYDSGKTRFSLLPWDALREVAAVREYGVRTYGSEHCWQDVEPRRYVDALLRHGAEIVADGIHSRDAESGLLHTAHIACNALFLTWFALRMQPATVEESPAVEAAPSDGEAHVKVGVLTSVPAIGGGHRGWGVKRSDGQMLPWVFSNREAAEYFIANYATGRGAEALRATDKGRGWLTDYAAEEETGEPAAPPPSEPNGRIKRDILPYVKVSEWPTGWYLSCLKGVQGADTMFFNAYAGGFWGPDRCNATSFPSADAAEAYLRKQAELNEGGAK